jgi:hypothetical protein
MKTYIVVENPFDMELLHETLSPSTLANTRFVIGGGKSSGVSLARSLLSDRVEPVLLVMDADTVNSEAIHEQEKEYSELLGSVAINTLYDVILAVPELEIILFQDIDTLSRLLNTPIDQEMVINSAFEPRKTLDILFKKNTHAIRNRHQLVRLLDEDARKKLGHHPIIKRINEFVLNAAEAPTT